MLIKQFVIDSSKKNQRILRGTQEIFFSKTTPWETWEEKQYGIFDIVFAPNSNTLLDIFIAHVDNEEWKKFILFEHRN